MKKMNFIGLAMAVVMTTGCAETMLVGTMVAPSVAAGSSIAMAAKTGQTMATTKWYDGIDNLKKDDPAAIRYAKLQDAARDIEARLGIPVSAVEVEVLAKLYEARNADLQTFAKDRRLTRAQIDEAVKTLRQKGLISVMTAPGRPGGFIAMATPMGTALGDPLNLGRDNGRDTPPDSPPVFVMNR